MSGLGGGLVVWFIGWLVSWVMDDWLVGSLVG